MKLNKLKSGLFMIAAVVLTLSSCDKDSGEGAIVTETLDIARFNGIKMPSAENVVIVQGVTQKVLAIGNQNIIDKVNKNVGSDGIWNMELSGSNSNYDLRYEITVPSMDYIKISGSGDVIAKNFSNEENVEVRISGSGNIQLENFVGQGALKVDVSGSGNVYALGSSSSFETLDVGISGSGNYSGFPLSVNSCTVNISGSGNIEVTANTDLFVKISGSGNVSYKGYPGISTNISGSGNVINAN